MRASGGPSCGKIFLRKPAKRLSWMTLLLMAVKDASLCTKIILRGNSRLLVRFFELNKNVIHVMFIALSRLIPEAL